MSAITNSNTVVKYVDPIEKLPEAIIINGLIPLFDNMMVTSALCVCKSWNKLGKKETWEKIVISHSLTDSVTKEYIDFEKTIIERMRAFLNRIHENKSGLFMCIFADSAKSYLSMNIAHMRSTPPQEYSVTVKHEGITTPFTKIKEERPKEETHSEPKMINEPLKYCAVIIEMTAPAQIQDILAKKLLQLGKDRLLELDSNKKAPTPEKHHCIVM